MREFVFHSRYQPGPTLTYFEQEEVKNEPMLFKCDREHALKYGGPITCSFLKKLEQTWPTSDRIYIDSRTHMLMPGWYPCIPGFHHDDVPRTRSDGQPDYLHPAYKAEHCMALVGDASVTQFALGQATFDEVPHGGVVYKEWHPVVKDKIAKKILVTMACPERQLIFFDWNTWHQGTPATKNGWRFFIRATRFSREKPANEIRKQTQVYLPHPMEGW